MTGPVSFSLAFYRFNRAYRSFSEAFVGTTFDPRQDIVLVTGGSSGLGLELVKRLVMVGTYKVIVLDLKSPILDESTKLGVIYYKCDISDHRAVLEVADKIQQEVGTVTVLINNAGITKGDSMMDLKYEDIEYVIRVNLLSSFYTIKAFLPAMIEKKRGYIVTVASVLGYISPANLSVYGASKSGLVAMHESLTYELGSPSLNQQGVKTLLLCTGQLNTSMFAGVVTPSTMLAPELDPDYVAGVLIEAIQLGRRGEIRLPFYGNFLPLMRALPWPAVELFRRLSGIDTSMKRFKGASSGQTSTSGAPSRTSADFGGHAAEAD